MKVSNRLIPTCLMISCLLLNLSGGITAQITNTQDDSYDISAVKRALQDQFPPGASFYGVTEKHLNRLGDRVSIALLKVLDEEDFKNPQKVKRVLEIMKHSFLYPQIISIAEDKKPKVTFFLLSYMEGKVNASLKREISKLKKFIEEKTTTVSPRP